MTAPSRTRDGAAEDGVPAADGASPALARFLAALAFLTPVAGAYAPTSLTFLALAAALALTADDLRAGRLWPQWSRPLAVVFALAVGWSGTTVLWAVVPGESLSKLWALAAVFLGTVALTARGRRFAGRDLALVRTGLWLGLGAALLLIVVDGLLGWHLLRWVRNDYEAPSQQLYVAHTRGMAVFALMLWPAVLAAAPRPSWLPPLLAAPPLFAAGLMVNSRSALVALCLGFGAWLLALALPRHGARAIAVAGLLAVLAYPLAITAALDAFAPADRAHISANMSVNHRFIIWEYAGTRALERPLLGHGLNSSRSLPGGRVEVPLLPGPDAPFGERISLHPHSAPLQLWLELGLPGAALGGALVFLVFWRVGRIPDRHVQALAAGQAMTAFAIASLSYGLWQTWWLAAMALAAMFMIIQLSRLAGSGHDPGRGATNPPAD